MKKPSSKARGKAPRPKFEDNKVDFSKFKMEPSAGEIAKLTGVGPQAWPPIEVLSPAKTVGRGSMTNLWLGGPGTVRTWATTPYAEFGRGFVWVNFEPAAYGITTFANYVITFNIETFGNVTFRLQSFPHGDAVYVINGKRTLQAIVRLASPKQAWASLSTRSLPLWRWYSSALKFPDIVVGPQ